MGAKTKPSSGGMTRRGFLKGAATAGALTIIPSRVWAGPSPNGKVNLACIGIGSRGESISGWIGGNGSALTALDADCGATCG